MVAAGTVAAGNTPYVGLDKPWIAVDIPRAGALTCSVSGANTPPQSFPGGNVYVAYSAFQNQQETLSQIMFSRSRDCGATWSAPVALSAINSNQAPAISIDPNTGAVYVAWRVFSGGITGTTDALMFVKSTDGGQTFSAPVTIASAAPATGQILYSPFDQATTITDAQGNILDARFRTNGYPALGVDGNSNIYVAWAQRGAGPSGDARIVMSSSVGGQTWSAPIAVDNPSSRGHQIMPAMSIAGGKLTLIYYDLRDTNTEGNFTPLGGGQYQETRQPIGDLASGNSSAVFTQEISDTYPGANNTRIPLQRRQTMDVHVAQLNLTSLAWGVARVSQYYFGSAPPQTGVAQVIEQLQVNPPNLPMFALGSVPFMGDYIDIAAEPFILNSSGNWIYNTAPDNSVVFHAVWTDNRDVRPPPPGLTWADYTPPTVAIELAKQLAPRNPFALVNFLAHQLQPAVPLQFPQADPDPRKGQTSEIRASSIFDPTQPRPACVSGQAGMRNQNIYTAQITQGLVAFSPGNAKPLTTLFNRAFVASAQNTTSVTKSFRLTILNQPPGGRASFSQTGTGITSGALLKLDAQVAAGSFINRPVFVESTSPTASVNVDVSEITAPNGTVVTGGLHSVIVLNPDPTNPANPDISNGEVYNPDISNPDISNPDISNPDISNPDISNPDISNPDISNPDISNAVLMNPDISNPDISNPDISNPDISNPDISNPDISNPDISNTSIQDVVWTISNNGNTTASYSVKTLTTGPGIPQGVTQQLVIYKVYGTPEVDGCALKYLPQTQLLLNVINPVFSTQSQIANTDISDSTLGNATVVLAPGESANVTMRLLVPNTIPPFNAAQVLISSITAHAANTADVAAGNTQPPLNASALVIITSSLPSVLTGATYTLQTPSAVLQSSGGVGQVLWTMSATAGQQTPPGMSLASTGALIGSPTTPGTYTFTVTATDSGTPPRIAVQTLSLTVSAPPPLAIITPQVLPTGYVGVPYDGAGLTLSASGGLGV